MNEIQWAIMAGGVGLGLGILIGYLWGYRMRSRFYK